MLLIVLRCIYFIVCAGAIATYVSHNSPTFRFGPIAVEHSVAIFGILIVLSQLVTIVDILLPRKRIEVISAINRCVDSGARAISRVPYNPKPW